jgi:hypothetical protein
MSQRAWRRLLAFVLALSLPFLGARALAVGVDEVTWETFGTNVQFTIIFVNTGSTPSEPISGEVNAQRFGAFLPNEGFICDLSVPSLQPGETFTIVCEAEPGTDIPLSAEKILPWELDSVGDCPPDDFWAGNVEIAWVGDGGGNVDVHQGTLQMCPGAGNSCIRVRIACPEAASWMFSEACAGWTFTLVDENFEPAPNPLPPGQFDGWICVQGDPADPVGLSCSYELQVTCGGETAIVSIVSEVCDCLALPVEPSTWGRIKSLIGE